MAPAPFQAFVNELMQAYQNQEYAQAMARLDQRRSEFPDNANTLYNIHYCLAALLGQKERALDLIEEALAAGQFWPASVLLGDSDLASLKDEPRFLSLVERSQAMFEALKATSKPERLVVEPASDADRPYPLLLVLHGRNGNAADTLEIWRSLANQGWLVAAVQSSQPSGSDAYCWDERELAVKEIQTHYAELVAQYPVDAGRVVLGGFSQGGGLVIQLALEEAVPVRGFLAVAPFLREAQELGEGLAKRLAQRLAGCHLSSRGVLITGGLDASQENFRQIEALLEGVSVPYQRVDYPDIAHEYPADFEAAARRALRFMLAE